jgi:hypothetical protein
MHFHNSIQESGQQLLNFESSAIAQEKIVLQLLSNIKCGAFFEVQNHLPDIHQDSLKRSLSNLAKEGKIVKDTVKANMVLNPKTGKKCHRYLYPQK